MAQSFQIKLPDRELTRLGSHISECYRTAIMDHQARIDRCRRSWKAFRCRVEPPAPGDEDKSNFRVPLTQWQVFTQWAKELGALFGDDAEIVAKPCSAESADLASKVGIYMTWRMFASMHLIGPLSVFIFRKILFGRSFAYRPWVQKKFDALINGQVTPQIYYEGPDFIPLWPDELIVPGEDVQSVQEFSWVLRQYRATPDDLLRGDGTLYQGIKDLFPQLVQRAYQQRREMFGEEVKREKDIDEGVIFDHSQSAGGSFVVHEWYGRWRPLIKGKGDAAVDNFDRRSMYEQDLVVRTLPEFSDKVIGVQDLMALYPKMPNRRPFSEAASYKDGSYWPMGLGELMESIEDELTVNHNLFTDAQQMAVGPLVFYSPSSGWDPESQRYGPKMAIPTEHPEKIQVVKADGDLQGCLVKEQSVLGYAERVSGNTDQGMGRTSDRPNQPRTASGQIALLQQGNIRADLDMRFLREDVGKIARELWELDQQFATEDVFFRVTGDDPDGLFDVKRGGAFMTPEERGGQYDFDIEFATNIWSREAKKQEILQLYELGLQNPMIASNPIAAWKLADKMFTSLGENLGDFLPQPPDLDVPQQPIDEWSKILRGEDVHVNPADNDDFHIQDHAARLMRYTATKGQSYDQAAVHMMIDHIKEHKQQKASKALQQMLIQSIAKSLAPQQPGLQPTPQQNVLDSPAAGNFVPGMPAGSPMPGSPGGSGQ